MARVRCQFAFACCWLFAAAAAGFAQEEADAHFGTTVVISAGLRGDIYFIPENSLKLPKFEKLKPVGTIYTTELNVPVHDFTQGFPGVTGRFEWFAIDYSGKFWIEKPGKYTFALLSDDGSKLYIDGHTVIDNDGTHSARSYGAVAKLKEGPHTIRISYFQGPRTQVALILAVAPPGDDDFSLFNTEDYLSPDQQREWRQAKGDAKLSLQEWKAKRKPGADFIMAPVIPVVP
jgi:hypothetical protein